jgi:DNA-binding phage protein
MPLTRDFKKTIQARVKNDPAFRVRLLSEALDSFISGDVETGKIVLRDYINATLGFDELAKVTKKSPKSLMRMFSHQGNPQARNLFSIVASSKERTLSLEGQPRMNLQRFESARRLQTCQGPSP